MINDITKSVIGAAIDVHRELGPVLLINFNVEMLVNGVRRVVNNLKE